MYDNRSENYDMSATAEASSLIQEIAEPRPVGDSVKAAVRRAARRAGCSFARARSLWYADERARVRADEMDRLRTVAKQQRETAHDPQLVVLAAQVATMADEIQAIGSRLADAEAQADRGAPPRPCGAAER